MQMALFGKGKPKVVEKEAHSVPRPAVEPGQERPGFRDREQRRLQRMFEGQASDFLFQADSLQRETGQGKGWQDRKPEQQQGRKLPELPQGGSSEAKG